MHRRSLYPVGPCDTPPPASLGLVNSVSAGHVASRASSTALQPVCWSPGLRDGRAAQSRLRQPRERRSPSRPRWPPPPHNPPRRGWAGSTRESWLPRPPYGSNFAVVSFISFSIWARVLSQRNEVTALRRAGTRERSGRQSCPARRPPAWPWGAVAVGQAALRGGGCVSGPPACPARAWVSLQPRGPAAAGPLPGTWQRPRSPRAPLPRSRGRSRACASRRGEDLHHPCQVHRGLLVSPYIFRNVTEYSAVIN